MTSAPTNGGRASKPSGSPERPKLRARFELSCELVGLEAPPVATRMSARRADDGFRFLLWTMTPRAEAVLDWISGQGSFQIQGAPASDASVFALSSKAAPAGWTWLADDFERPCLAIEADGQASLTLEGHLEDLEAYAAELGRTAVSQDIGPVRWSKEPSTHALLTGRQHEAVLAASAAGYYEIPRSIRLKDLADKLGMSMGALSTLLRRAEERLIRAYLQADPVAGSMLDALGKADPGADGGWDDLASILEG